VFDILHRVGIKAPLAKVYDALATPEGVSQWWTRETSGERKAGGMLKTVFTADGRVLGGFALEILELRPGQSVVWQVVEGPQEWLGTKIRFDLKQEDEQTIVLFKHEGWKEPIEFMGHCSTKWAVYLLSLKSYGETGTGQPSPNDVRIGNWH
jgi:uncharacterized protein YndB with AHSA1/START domain